MDLDGIWHILRLNLGLYGAGNRWVVRFAKNDVAAPIKISRQIGRQNLKGEQAWLDEVKTSTTGKMADGKGVVSWAGKWMESPGSDLSMVQATVR